VSLQVASQPDRRATVHSRGQSGIRVSAHPMRLCDESHAWRSVRMESGPIIGPPGVRLSRRFCPN